MTCRRIDVADYPPGATFGPRTLDDFEFVWLLHGEATWECGDIRLSLIPGQLLLARPGMRDRFFWDPHVTTRHAFVHFTGAPAGCGSPNNWPLTSTLNEPLDALCDYLLWLAGSDRGDARQRANDVLALLVTLFTRGPLPAAVPSVDRLPDHVTRVGEHVARVWSESGQLRPVSLDEMARAAALSRGHLSRVFSAHFGCGPVAAFERIRLARAATLLVRSNLPIATVATTCGFVNPYHFSRRFRGAYGRPPRDYRHHPDETDPLTAGGLSPLARYMFVGLTSAKARHS